MYYFVYALLYAVSLLPMRVLYLFSDVIFFFLYYVFDYRKKVVMGNISLAFPEKSDREKAAIAKTFYKTFIDTFIETLKVLSMSEADFDRRCVGNFEVINDLVNKGRSVQLLGGHLFNWEYANLVLSKHIRSVPCIGVYGKVENKVFERLALKLRSRFGTVLIPTIAFREQMKTFLDKPYTMFLLADQNPQPHKGYWANFMGKQVPFVPGPHEAAVKNNAAVVFVDFIKIKRGYYQFKCEVITVNAVSMGADGILLRYRDLLENSIRCQPGNYLWSHRRWKFEYDHRFRQIEKPLA